MNVLFFQGITESFGSAIHALSTTHLTDGVIKRSKRMMLDTLGVGLLGTRTSVFNKVLQYSQVQSNIQPVFYRMFICRLD